MKSQQFCRLAFDREKWIFMVAKIAGITLRCFPAYELMLWGRRLTASYSLDMSLS